MPAVIDDVQLSVGQEDRSGRRMAIASPYLYKMQRRHFLMFNVLPFIGLVAAVALAVGYQPIGWLEISLFLVMWMLTGLGISTGFHRLLCHRSFKTTPLVRVALTVLGCMAAQGPAISWVAMHRRHHQIADQEGDVHSPNLHGDGLEGSIKGFLYAHIFWMLKHDYPNVAHYAKDLLKETEVVKASRRYFTWVLLGLLIPAVIAGMVTMSWYGVLMGFLWGGVVRLFVVGQLIASLNSFLHMIGRQRYKLHHNRNDNSRNNWILGLLVWGEGWHNNHHAFPFSASFGLAWYRVDFGYWLILILKSVGLAWDIKLPTKEKIRSDEIYDLVNIN